jgi:hypothetical protein
MKKVLIVLLFVGMTDVFICQTPAPKSVYNGLNLSLGNLSRLSRAKTRSISPENFTGEKGKGGMATEGTGANAARDSDLPQLLECDSHLRAEKSDHFLTEHFLKAAPLSKLHWTRFLKRLAAL